MTMKLTRRQATIGGLSLLAGTSMSTVSAADLGELARHRTKGLRISGSPPTPTSTATRW